MTFKWLVFMLPVGLSIAVGHAQSSGGGRSVSEELGRRTFQQRCAVCHTRATLSVKTPFAPVLSNDRLEGRWDAIKEAIVHGRLGMPAFQYGLQADEVDAIIDYLKTGPTFVDAPDGTDTIPSKLSKPVAETSHRRQVLLSGKVKATAGGKLEGVPVSAKAEDSNITTTVFTDMSGEYYFPPLSTGKYIVWAQTQAFETSKRGVGLTANRHEDFELRPLKDFFRQLSGDQMMSALPEDTPHDKRMKQEFKHSCLGCHESSYVLMNRFDEAGWNAVMNVMKHITGGGNIGGVDQSPLPIIQYQQKELAEYLARARGPGPSPMKVRPQARPTGEAARVTFTEYDVPVDWSWDKEVMGGVLSNNGSDWSLGNPSVLNGGRGVHDAQADRDGNIWFSYNGVSTKRTIGKINTTTGELKDFGIPGAPGLASMGHSLVLGNDGKIWFNVNPRGPDYQKPEKLAGIDPKTEKLEFYSPPKGMPAPGGAVTMDVDGKGFVWVSSTFGALRFDTHSHDFKYFESNTKYFEGVGNTYGAAGDRDGNGWWVQMYSGLDTVSKGDVATGKTLDVKLTPVAGVRELFDADELRMYKLAGSSQETGYPWGQGPRRMAVDKNADVAWVCDYWGGNVAKIDTHTLKFEFVDPPNPNLAPYAATVDKHHNAWVTFMNGDQVGRYNPATKQWTMFRYPSMGTDVRWITLHETPDGHLQIFLPYFTSSRIARMTLRTEAEINDLKAKAQQDSPVKRK